MDSKLPSERKPTLSEVFESSDLALPSDVEETPSLLEIYNVLLKDRNYEEAKTMATKITSMIEGNINVTAKEVKEFGKKLREKKLFLESIAFFDAAFAMFKKMGKTEGNLYLMRICVWETKETNIAMIEDDASMKMVVRSYVIPLMREKLRHIEDTSSVSEQFKCLQVCWVLHDIEWSEYLVDEWEEREKTVRFALMRMKDMFRSDVMSYRLYGFLLNNLGAVCDHTLRFEEAASFYKQAIDAFKAATDFDDEEKKKRSVKKSENKLKHTSADLFETFAESIKDSDTTAYQFDCKDVKQRQHAMDSLFVDKTSMVVGPNGAVLKVGGCELTIPEGALNVDVSICITSLYDRDTEMNRATPLLKCEPHGLQFEKNVEVVLPTCYLTDGSVSVTAKARRSEDGEIWETIKSFDYRIERCFKFSITEFSWYDVILKTLFNLAVEKLIVCCVPHQYSKDPKELVIVCNIFDAVLEHKQENCTDLFKKSIALGSGESSVLFQLRNNDLSITPDERKVEDARATKLEQVSFFLEKRQINLLFQPVKLIVRAGDSEKENEFYIINSNSETEEQPEPTAEPGKAPSDNRPKVSGQSVSGAMIGCDKAYYTANHHHHYYDHGDSAKRVAPPTRESIENGGVDDRVNRGTSAGSSYDAHERFHGAAQQERGAPQKRMTSNESVSTDLPDELRRRKK